MQTATDAFLKIDIHTHIIPEHFPRFSQKFGYGGFIHLEHHKPCCARMMIDNNLFREIESNCWDPKQRMHECEHHGVQVQVLSTIPVMFNYWAKHTRYLALFERPHRRNCCHLSTPLYWFRYLAHASPQLMYSRA